MIFFLPLLAFYLILGIMFGFYLGHRCSCKSGRASKS